MFSANLDSNDFIKDIPVTDDKGNLIWLHSKIEADDVAVFPMLPDQNHFETKGIPISLFVDDSTLKSDAVEEGDNLYFIGLMAQFYGSKRNYPVVRKGTLAMITEEEIPTESGLQRVFIAQLESWPGNSGSPVFLNLGGFRGNSVHVGQDLRLLGILAGDFMNRFKAPVVGQPEAFLQGGNDYNIGVSYVIPAMRIKEILDSAEPQRDRDLRIQQTSKPQ